MVITDYRVQTVIRTYSRQLQRSKLSKLSQETAGEGQRPVMENVTISDEARKRFVLDRLASQTRERTAPLQEQVPEDQGDLSS